MDRRWSAQRIRLSSPLSPNLGSYPRKIVLSLPLLSTNDVNVPKMLPRGKKFHLTRCWACNVYAFLSTYTTFLFASYSATLGFFFALKPKFQVKQVFGIIPTTTIAKRVATRQECPLHLEPNCQRTTSSTDNSLAPLPSCDRYPDCHGGRCRLCYHPSKNNQLPHGH